MNTKILMVASSIFMAVSGLACEFFPHELLQYLKIEASGELPIMIQLLGALYLSFAILNWTAKDNLIGGIYSKPVTLANFSHFFIAVMALVKGVDFNTASFLLIVYVIFYSMFTILFGLILFGNPLSKTS